MSFGFCSVKIFFLVFYFSLTSIPSFSIEMLDISVKSLHYMFIAVRKILVLVECIEGSGSKVSSFHRLVFALLCTALIYLYIPDEIYLVICN